MWTKRRSALVVPAAVVLLTVADIGAQERPGVLVGTDWLADHLDDPSVVVLHVGMGDDAMPSEWIPGARFLDYHRIAQDLNGLSTEIPPVGELVDAFEAVGVSNESHVIVYGTPAHAAARVFVTLDYLGHGDRSSVLDGGLDVWKAEGRQTSSAPGTFAPATFVPDVRDDVLVSAEWIRDRLGDRSLTLVDARPEIEYSGERAPRMGGASGHIPGAYNLYWEDLLESRDNPVLKRLDEVKARYEEAGASEDGVVVSYCYIGMRASYTYLVSRHLGYDTRFYDGSWNEWSQKDGYPVTTGTKRR